MSHELTHCSHGVPMRTDCECKECDRIWGHSFMTDEQKTLAQFYGVSTKDELIAAQAHHIEKLQIKLPPIRDEFRHRPVRGG
jgi:hypothetical protein